MEKEYRSTGSLSYWGVIMALLVVGVYGFAVSNPQLYASMGAGVYGRWFTDTRAVLLCSDLVAAGGDPTVPNATAIHFYSHWWFWLSDLGLTSSDYDWLGGGMVMAFLLAAIVFINPKTLVGMILGGFLLVAPPTQLGVNRGNVDLLIFALLAPLPWLLNHLRAWWCFLAPVVIAFCAGLKYYPVLAGGVLLFAQVPLQRRKTLLLLMVVLTALVAVSVTGDYMRVASIMPHPTKIYAFGADRFWVLLGMTSLAGRCCSLALFGLAAVFWLRFKIKLPTGLSAVNVTSFALGAFLVLGCFMMANNFSYRLIFSFFMFPLLMELGCSALGGAFRTIARVGLGLMVCLFWVDGCFTYKALVSLMNEDVGMAEFYFGANKWVSAAFGWIWVLLIEGILIAVLFPVIKELWVNPEPKEGGDGRFSAGLLNDKP